MKPANKRKKKGAVPIDGRFVPILFDELDSKAYASLKGNSAKLYAHLKGAARTVASIQGSRERDVQFDFTYCEAKRHGFSESTFIRAIRDLWEKGFIDIVERGGLRGNGRSNSHYRLCAFWKTYGNGWTDRKKCQADPFADTCEPRRADARW